MSHQPPGERQREQDDVLGTDGSILAVYEVILSWGASSFTPEQVISNVESLDPLIIFNYRLITPSSIIQLYLRVLQVCFDSAYLSFIYLLYSLSLL